MATRTATHANSWYSGRKETLNGQLDGWLAAVGSEIAGVGQLPPDSARVIIAPHAGYSYSGPAAAWAYKSLNLSRAKRVFILGPSHHVYLDRCDLSACKYYSTPLGNLTLDTEVLQELHEQGEFGWMSQKTDQEEHSIEMHLPYIYKMLDLAGKIDHVKIVPILVGAINATKEKAYGTVLAKYLEDPKNVFVVSSDFCHWGSRFAYTHYYTTLPSTDPKDAGSGISLNRLSKAEPHQIYESIEVLDRQGMAAIETGSHDKFVDYLKTTHNTICGRHPIGVIMAAVEELQNRNTGDGKSGRFKFVRYERSNNVEDPTDSSVSYASAFAVV